MATKPPSGPISQHKRLAMGMPVTGKTAPKAAPSNKAKSPKA